MNILPDPKLIRNANMHLKCNKITLLYVTVFSFILFFPTNASLAEETDNIPDKSQPEITAPAEKQNLEAEHLKESEKDRIFRKDTILRINEVLQKVQQNYPALADRLCGQDIENILKSLVGTLNCGMEYFPTSAEILSQKQPQTKKSIESYPAIIISGHKVLYIRIDSFTPDTIKQLQTDCVSSFRLANPPVGIIIDLRNAQDNNNIDALKALGLFIPPEEIPLPDKVKPLKKVFKTPVLLLIGEWTKGSAEIFAKLLADSGSGMLLGAQTAGFPFPKQKIQLDSGAFLMVPIVPEYLNSIKPEAVIPAIKTSAYPQIEFKKIREEAGSENNDECLQRAIDLIICLQALSAEKK